MTASFWLRRGGVLVVVLGVSCVLSACGRGDAGVWASAGSGASEVSGSVSSTVDLPQEQAAAREAALAMAAPERPGNMDEDSPEGAVATGSYFVQLYPYVYATGDLEQWRAMTRQDCLFCGSVITNVTSLHDSGGWKDPWVHTITETGYSDPGPGSEYSRVDIVFSQEAAYTYDGTGAPPKVSDPVPRTLLILAMRYEDGHWIIREGQVE